MIFALLLCHFMLYYWHRCKRRKNEKGYRGIYVTKDVLEDEMYMFQLKNSKAIFCNYSSLYLWNLTEKKHSVTLLIIKIVWILKQEINQ